MVINKGANLSFVTTYFDNRCLEYLEVKKWRKIHANCVNFRKLILTSMVVFQTSLSENKSVSSKYVFMSILLFMP